MASPSPEESAIAAADSPDPKPKDATQHLDTPTTTRPVERVYSNDTHMPRKRANPSTQPKRKREIEEDEMTAGDTGPGPRLKDATQHLDTPTTTRPVERVFSSDTHMPRKRANPSPQPGRKREMEEDEMTAGDTGPDGPAPTTAPSRKKKDHGGSNLPHNVPYSGNKVRHLKKDDGEPLWRKDIQYDFLKAVFEDTTACFTMNSGSDGATIQTTFANLYIDAMARSSKTSKILRDKLLSEHEPAKNMAMVCLLVNLGRMNTTLNFFPEMRAQLRTYHAIPSLQAHQDPNSYKQLQDAPRLKSILKGASEDRPEPNSLDKIKARTVPRTNPVNLIFVLAQFSPRVTELHMPPGYDFYDLIMKTTLSSRTRARAFLWLMWFYLESDFTEEGAEENPFGPGVDYDVSVKNQGVPRFDILTPEEAEQEDLDTPEEVEYGIAKMRERKRIIEADQAAYTAENGPPKRGPKPKLHLPPEDGGPALPGSASPALMSLIKPRYDSDIDSSRSTPPPRSLGPGGMRMQSAMNSSKGKGILKHQFVGGSSPAPQFQPESQMRRPRPLTAHQIAVEQNRNQRVDYILCRGLRKEHHRARKLRRQEGIFHRALARASRAENVFDDSEDESKMDGDPGAFRARGSIGLVQLRTEEDDFGEQQSAYAAAFRRIGRRLDRWDTQKGMHLGVMGTNRVPQVFTFHGASRDADETEDEKPAKPKNKRLNGRFMDQGMDLGSGDDGDEDLDDVDKELLGIGGDETEDELSEGMEVD